MIELPMTIDNEEYKVVTETEADVTEVTLLIQAMKKFNDLEKTYKTIKEEYESAREKMEKMFSKAYDDTGLKTIGNDKYSCTFIPEGKPSVKLVLDEEKVIEAFHELEMPIDLFYKKKEVKGKKESVTWRTK